MTGAEEVLVHDWCQQYPVHSVGDLAFGPTVRCTSARARRAPQPRRLRPREAAPAARSQRTPAASRRGVGGDARATDRGGRVAAQPEPPRRARGRPRARRHGIRVEPGDRRGLADNPMASSSGCHRAPDRGPRPAQPVPLARRLGTNEIWIADVGNLLGGDRPGPGPAASPVRNFGWPCYEGNGRQAAWDALDLSLCESLYAQSGGVTPPFTPTTTRQGGRGELLGRQLVHHRAVVRAYAGARTRAEYDGALFFADRSRRCIWAMLRSLGDAARPGLDPDLRGQRRQPVDLQVGPTATCSTPTSTAGRSRGSATGRQARPRPPSRGDADERRHPLTVEFDGSPTAPRTRTPARR